MERKQIVNEKLQTLSMFIAQMKALNSNPYAKEIDVEKLLTDIDEFVKEVREDVDKIEEVTSESSEEPDKAE